MGLLLMQNAILGVWLSCLIFFIYAKGSKYYTYIGSCLLILSLNEWLMEYHPEYMNDFPLRMIDYTVLCTSVVMMEMLEPTTVKERESKEVKGLSLRGFEKIEGDDEDEGWFNFIKFIIFEFFILKLKKQSMSRQKPIFYSNKGERKNVVEFSLKMPVKRH